MKIKSFTLAEVLITLGIIGIIAAMTLPALIQNHNNKLTEARLKKFYSIMNQAILQSIVVNGPVEGWNYLVSEKKEEDGTLIVQNVNTNKSFNKYFAPYIKVTTEKIADKYGTERLVYRFADGSSFSFRAWHNREIEFYPSNPKKCLSIAENDRFGTCMFLFEFYPLSSHEDWKYLYKKGVEPYLYKWDGRRESLYTGHYGCKNNGTYCTALIQQNGWQVPEDYPRKIRY